MTITKPGPKLADGRTAEVFAWGEGPAEVVLECDRQLELKQAWSPSVIRASQTGGRFTLRCTGDAVMCAVTARPESVPAVVTPVQTGPRWWGIVAGDPVDPRALDLANVGGPGVYLWWNPDRPLVVGGYDETLERLVSTMGLTGRERFTPALQDRMALRLARGG